MKDRTIPLRPRSAPQNPESLALAALGWALQCEDRAQRYLELTGLDPDSLRAGLGDPLILASALEFLANHEPDLIRAAEALAVTPEELVAAKDALTA
ncbi:DUF3572 family protein [Erythrobacter sp. WG]|uniref:DUF3572 family protein n=1 Tax=Erythrobacter sp. WG TaxID=2985510 RepID=UPI002271B534|nr:DUF3572 family protein [Erythrobacter sp. WG]MCX9145864.1 DUF3572 domain-containing protein [Erythrobacter sp. WG]